MTDCSHNWIRMPGDYPPRHECLECGLEMTATRIITQQSTEIASLKQEVEKLLPFAWACIDTLYDWHGSEMFDLLAQHKLIKPHTAEKPCQKGGCNCSEHFGDYEWPVECWRPTIDPPQEPSDANRRRRAQP